MMEVNEFLISIIDLLVTAWPETPPHLKLSWAIAQLIIAFPAAPWYLVGKFIEFASWVFPVVATIKTWKMVWP